MTVVRIKVQIASLFISVPFFFFFFSEIKTLLRAACRGKLDDILPNAWVGLNLPFKRLLGFLIDVVVSLWVITNEAAS